MPIAYIAGSEDNLGLLSRSGRRAPHGSTRYTVRCRGLTEKERCALERELDHRFGLVPAVRRNPTLPSVNWHEVSHVALLIGTAAVPKLLNILEAIVKERLTKGRKPKTVALYGPDGKVVKRLRKSPLR